MQNRGYQMGEWRDLILEAAYAESQPIWTNKQMEKFTPGYQVECVMLELDYNVAQSGGDLNNADAGINSISSLTLELGGHTIYAGVTGAQLADLIRRTAPFGIEYWPFADPRNAAPTDGNNADLLVRIPLLFSDCRYSLGYRSHNWPSDLLKELRISLSTAADTATDTNATVTGTIRIRAWGRVGGDKVIAPIPEYRRHATLSGETQINRQGETIRNLFAVDTAWTEEAAQVDKLFIDSNRSFFPENHTIAEMEDERALRELIASQGLVSKDASTGAQPGVTDSFFATSRYLDYIDGVGDLGDSPVHQAKKVVLEPAAARDVRVWSYLKWDEGRINWAAQLMGQSIAVVEKPTLMPGVWEPVDVAKGTIMPIRVGAH